MTDDRHTTPTRPATRTPRAMIEALERLRQAVREATQENLSLPLEATGAEHAEPGEVANEARG